MIGRTVHKRSTRTLSALTRPTRHWLDLLTATWVESDLPMAAAIVAYMAVLTGTYGRDDAALAQTIWADTQLFHPSFPRL